MTGIDTYIQNLLDAEAIRRRVTQQVIQFLRLAPSSRGLDAGCGIGLQTMLLADAVGPDGRVTGLDILPEMLAYGKRHVSRCGYAQQISFCQGSVRRPPFPAQHFDWVWSADCIGYPIGDLPPLLKELMRVVKPGGWIFLLAWSSQQVLPGHPILEARLNAASSSYLPYLHGADPNSSFLRAPHWLRQAGLEQVQAKTFVGDIQSPLTEQERVALVSLFQMLWGQPQPGESLEDRQAYLRLCEAGSPDCILDVPGYYGFFTYTLFSGRVPVKPPHA